MLLGQIGVPGGIQPLRREKRAVNAKNNRLGSVGGVVSACSFEKLLRLLDEQLDLAGKLEVLIHLKMCDICREAVHQIARDREEFCYLDRAYPEQRKIA